jgi:hypothetical protein
LAFFINRTIGLLWEVSLSHPLGFSSSFYLVWCVLHLLEKRGEKGEISPIFQRVGGCLGGFQTL